MKGSHGLNRLLETSHPVCAEPNCYKPVGKATLMTIAKCHLKEHKWTRKHMMPCSTTAKQTLLRTMSSLISPNLHRHYHHLGSLSTLVTPKIPTQPSKPLWCSKEAHSHSCCHMLGCCNTLPPTHFFKLYLSCLACFCPSFAGLWPFSFACIPRNFCDGPFTKSPPPPPSCTLYLRLQGITWLCREEVRMCPPYIHKRLEPVVRLARS